MKRSLAALSLALVLALPLCGCTSLLRRSYSSSVPHMENAQTEDASVLRAETYRGLVDAILYFVNAHADHGVVRLYNYTGDVEKDLDAACAEVLREDPLAAYAVEELSCTCSRIVSYYEASVSLSYSHTAREVDAIRYAGGTANLRQELAAAIAAFAPTLTLRVSYFPGDEAAVRSLAAQAYTDTPQAAFGMPELEVSIYPETGVQRIVDVSFRWSRPQSQLAARSAKLTALAREQLEAYPPAGDRYTPPELALLLQQCAGPIDPEGGSDPLSALSGEGAGPAGHVAALRVLCQLAGIESVPVTGRDAEGAELWLAVECGGFWRHMPLTDGEPRLYTDREMDELGYIWNAESVPPCPDPEPEPEESGVPEPERQP